MIGLGEHVDRLAADEFAEPTFAQKLSIARQRGGTAADVDNDWRSELAQHLHRFGVHTRARRIDDHHVRQP